MLAASKGHEEVVHCIVSRFPRCIDWRNKTGVTAMMHAAKNGCDAVVNVARIESSIHKGKGGQKADSKIPTDAAGLGRRGGCGGCVG